MSERAFHATVLLVLLALPAGAGEDPPSGKSGGARPEAKGEEGSPNRNRWDKLSPEERERLREIYRRLQELPPAERERLLEKLRTMPAKERRKSIELAQKRLRELLDRPQEKTAERERPGPGPLAFPIPPEERRRLQGLPPEERRRETQKIYQDVFQRWLRTLPPDLRERVKRFTPREQLEFFRAYRQSELLYRTFPEEGEEEALLALPAERLRSLIRPAARRPEGISESSWERWRKLAPTNRARMVRRLESLRQDRTVPSPPPANAARPGENTGPAAQK